MPTPIYGNFPLYNDPRLTGLQVPFGFQTGNTFPGWSHGFLPVKPQKQRGFWSNFLATALPITVGVGLLGVFLGRRKPKTSAVNTPSTSQSPTPKPNTTSPGITGPVIDGSSSKYGTNGGNTPGGYGGNAFSNYHQLLENPTAENLELANKATIQYSDKPLPGLLQNSNSPRFKDGVQNLLKGAQEDFDRYDLNHDGTITREELVAKNFQGALQTLQLQGVNPYENREQLKQALEFAKNEAALQLQTEDFVRSPEGKTDGKITRDEHTAVILTQDAGINSSITEFKPNGQITQQELTDFRNTQLRENGIAEIQNTLNIVHRLYGLAEKTGIPQQQQPQPSSSTPDTFKGIDGAKGPFGDNGKNAIGGYGRNAFVNYKNAPAGAGDQPVRYNNSNNPQETIQNLLGYAREYLKTLDTDGSKTITTQELLANFEQKFAKRGDLSPAQAKQAAAQAASLFFNVSNLNGDQVLSLDELAATFLLQDAGNINANTQIDGILTQEEYKAYEASVLNNPAQTQQTLQGLQQRFDLSRAAKQFLVTEAFPNLNQAQS